MKTLCCPPDEGSVNSWGHAAVFVDADGRLSIIERLGSLGSLCRLYGYNECGSPQESSRANEHENELSAIDLLVVYGCVVDHHFPFDGPVSDH